MQTLFSDVVLMMRRGELERLSLINLLHCCANICIFPTPTIRQYRVKYNRLERSTRFLVDVHVHTNSSYRMYLRNYMYSLYTYQVDEMQNMYFVHVTL